MQEMAQRFVLAHKLAREAGGKLLLRIDDLDIERVRPEYVEDIFQTLEWLDIAWNEGPKDAEELRRLWSQQYRLVEYLKLLDNLRETGDLYACYVFPQGDFGPHGYHGIRWTLQES
jgi:glutamyl-tRNA synthetase